MRLFLYILLFFIFFLSVYVLLFGRKQTSKLLNRIFFIAVIVALTYFVIFLISQMALEPLNRGSFMNDQISPDTLDVLNDILNTSYLG